MKQFKNPVGYVGAMMCALVFGGCSGGDVLKTEYVEGTVTLDGSPIAEATVMLVPVTQGQGLSATGQTDDRGVFRLTAANLDGRIAQAGAGTLPGEYYVGVLKSVSETHMSEEESREKGVPYAGPKPGESPPITHIVPVKYNDPKASGLKATVQSGKNTIPLELTSS
jgi:hypothetical protein